MNRNIYAGAERLQNMFISPIRSFTQKAKAMQAAGNDVIFFTMGEPDFDTPQAITNATVDALNSHKTHYAPIRGVQGLREQIAVSLKDTCGISYDATSEIVLCSGGAEALNNAFFSAVGPGDEVIIFTPAFMHYVNMVVAAGATPVCLPQNAADGYQINIQQLRNAVTQRTRMIVVNNPGNPTGVVYTKKTLEAICKFACEFDLLVLADEIYNRIVYNDAEFFSVASFPGMRERTLLVNGFSKTYAMTGWRLAYIASDKRLINHVAVIHGYSTTCSPTFIQEGLIETMNAPETEKEVQAMLDSFKRRGQLVIDGISSIKGISFVKPQGAFYTLIDVSRTGMDGEEFANALLENKFVAVVPAIAFGKECGNLVRLSFATSDARIKEGLTRIREFVESLQCKNYR